MGIRYPSPYLKYVKSKNKGLKSGLLVGLLDLGLKSARRPFTHPGKARGGFTAALDGFVLAGEGVAGPIFQSFRPSGLHSGLRQQGRAHAHPAVRLLDGHVLFFPCGSAVLAGVLAYQVPDLILMDGEG